MLCLLTASCGPAISSMPVQAMSNVDYRRGFSFGEKYYLPRALVWARLVVNPATGARVIVDQPDLIADNGSSFIDAGRLTAEEHAFVKVHCQSDPPQAPAGPFTLAHRLSGFHKDTLALEVGQSLLKSVSAETEEQTTETLTGLANSLGMLGGLEAGSIQDEVLADVHFDPADCEQRTAAGIILSDAIEQMAVPMLAKLKKASGAKGALKDLELEVPAPRVNFAMLGFSPFRSPEVARTIPNDCRVGICVPVLVPASISVSVGDRRRESAIIHIPNRSEPVAIPVSRSGFADIKTVLTLDHGVLTKREVTRGSEFATAAALPAIIVGAYLDQLSAGFTKRKTAIDDQIALAKARGSAKEKAEAGELAAGKVLVEVPIPGLSVIGAAAPAPQALQNDVGADSSSPPAAKAEESPQGDGEPATPPAKDGKASKGGKAGKGQNGGTDG